MSDFAYKRVSTGGQSTDRQLDDTGIVFEEEWEDKASGSTRDRPELKACLKHLRKNDTLHVHSIDRLCRNLLDLQNIVNDLVERGVVVRFHKEALTFSGDSNPMNKLTLQIMGSFAEFERSMIASRREEGVRVARAKGVKFGRPDKHSKKEAQKIAKECRQIGANKQEIAKKYAISRTTLYKIISDNKKDLS